MTRVGWGAADAMARSQKPKLKIMLSSTVYGREALIDRVYDLLESFGYKVWNSHKGSLPIRPDANTYENCIAAVDQCDIFFGLINPNYGSGLDGLGGPSITHRELDRAIALDKLRFMLAHEQVITARRLLMDLSINGTELTKAPVLSTLKLKKGSKVIDDLRLIDMYDAATQEHLPIAQRTNNWVQKYRTEGEVLGYVGEQFSRYDDLDRFVQDWRAKQGLTP